MASASPIGRPCVKYMDFVKLTLRPSQRNLRNEATRKEVNLQCVEEEQEDQVEPVPLELLPEVAEALGLGLLQPTLPHLAYFSVLYLIYRLKDDIELKMMIWLVTPPPPRHLWHPAGAPEDSSNLPQPPPPPPLPPQEGQLHLSPQKT